MHAYIHACIYTYIHTYIHAYMHTCIFTIVNVCILMSDYKIWTASLNKPFLSFHYDNRFNPHSVTSICYEVIAHDAFKNNNNNYVKPTPGKNIYVITL